MLPCSFSLFVLLITTMAQEVPRPRGTPLSAVSLYQPRENGDWTCLDGQRTIRFVEVNDDYCDCDDGSDEPGTSACANGRYHCLNAGYRPLDIASTRVNDGICDCCDGSDEYAQSPIKCANTCDHLGQAEANQRRNEAELYRRGAAKRAEMIELGKQLRSERELRKSELQRRRDEQEAVRTEKDILKRNAEALESEALEVYKEQQSENPNEGENDEEHGDSTLNAGETGADANRREAIAHFVRYDVNKDGFVEITELQVDIHLDRDRNGVVTVEEAKYFLDERERIDVEGFTTLSWPRIKPILMLAQGLFKPPHSIPDDSTEEKLKNKEVREDLDLPTGTMPDHLADGEEEDLYEEDDDDDEDVDEDVDGDHQSAGVGSVQEVGGEGDVGTPPVVYDPETQRLIDLANEARDSYAEVQRTISDIENEIKGIDQQIDKDYGPADEYASMDGECYAFEDRQYVYTLCPFDRASQKDRSGGSETTLGRWDQWAGANGEKYARQKYSHGASCWNGPQRSVLVHLRCALEHRLVAVSEPNRCEYFFEFETPAACDVARLGGEQFEDHHHDEL